MRDDWIINESMKERAQTKDYVVWPNSLRSQCENP